ncbi:iron-sulfur cluster assembly accessory protein [Alphaproteobacteria bacterium]|nr:iron-sulfur cluster assembly accessory protein [Alphaproteobacteria bacterium]
MQEIINIVNNDFKLSQNASNRIKTLLKSEAGSYFRISVLGGGCSGFQYDFSFTSSPNEDDLIFKENGISYLIDKTSIDFLTGSTLEYISELAGAYFKIENPNATANCGCGTSFSI